MKNKPKSVLQNIRKYRYDQIHKQEAMHALKCIESDTGYTLTADQKRKIKDYAKEVLGSTKCSYWLYVYTAYNQKFKEGWIPDNYFGYSVAPKINKGIGSISNIKTLSRKIVETDLLPDKYYLIDNVLYDTNYQVITEKEVSEILFSNDNEYFLKKDDSNQGRGVIRITKENFNISELLKHQDAVIQEPIIQAEWFDKIIPDSVATIRITTVKEKDHTTRMRAAYLRVGRKNIETVQSNSAIRIPILDRKGNLGTFGADPEWKRHSTHPDTGFEFKNKSVPIFEKAVIECEKLHQKLPHFSIIGWDVSITEKGEIKLIEWNAGHPDIKFSEASTGPCFTGLDWF